MNVQFSASSAPPLATLERNWNSKLFSVLISTHKQSERHFRVDATALPAFAKFIFHFHFLLLLSVCGFCFSLRREWERPLRFLLSFGDTWACSLAITYVYAFGLLSCHCRRWQFMLLQKLYVVRSSLGNPYTMWNLNICSSYARIARSCVLSPFHNI